MPKIEIVNPCSCVKKRKSWSQPLEFDTLEEASTVAFEMCEQGNTKFCKRHNFTVEQDQTTLKIIAQPNKK